MPRPFTALLAAFVFAGCSLLVVRADDPRPAAPGDKPAADKQEAPEKKDSPAVKTRQVKLRHLTLEVPESWKQGEPTSNLRLGEFKIPAAGEDDKPVELAIFAFGGGGSVQQNVERWINQFDAAGRKAKVTHGEAPQGKYVFVDVAGTYHQPVGPPVLQRTERLEDARMLAVILQVKDQDVYYLKLAGPQETVSASAEHLRRAFGGDAEKEKPLDLEGEGS